MYTRLCSCNVLLISMSMFLFAAYEVLSDKELRAKYDRGEPVFDNQGGGHPHHNAHDFFRQQFHSSGGGGGQRFHVRFG